MHQEVHKHLHAEPDLLATHKLMALSSKAKLFVHKCDCRHMCIAQLPCSILVSSSCGAHLAAMQ